jgi:hypothetical protein
MNNQNIPTYIIEHLNSSLQNTESISTTTIPAPKDLDVLRQVIGRRGCHFNRLTSLCGVDFIWHNKKNNTIEIWGPNEKVVSKACIKVNKHIKYFMAIEKNKKVLKSIVFTGNGTYPANAYTYIMVKKHVDLLIYEVEPDKSYKININPDISSDKYTAVCKKITTILTNSNCVDFEINKDIDGHIFDHNLFRVLTKNCSYLLYNKNKKLIKCNPPNLSHIYFI